MAASNSKFIKNIRKYSAVSNFCNLDFALAYTKKRGYNFIDRDGNELLPLECSKITVHSGGVIILTDKRLGSTTYIDSSFNELNFINNNDLIVNFDSNGGLYGKKQEFNMSKPPKDGSELPILIDIQNDGIVLHYDRDSQITTLYDLCGNVIYSANYIEVLKKKNNGIVISDRHQIIDFAENIHLKFRSISSDSWRHYHEHGKFRILGDHIWYNNKLIPLIVSGSDSIQFNDDGSILFYHNDKYSTYCSGPHYGSVIQIKSYTNNSRYNIHYGEYEVDENKDIHRIKDIRPYVSDWQPITLNGDVTTFDMKKWSSLKIQNHEQKQKHQLKADQFKDNVFYTATIIGIIALCVLLFILTL